MVSKKENVRVLCINIDRVQVLRHGVGVVNIQTEKLSQSKFYGRMLQVGGVIVLD